MKRGRSDDHVGRGTQERDRESRTVHMSATRVERWLCVTNLLQHYANFSHLSDKVQQVVFSSITWLRLVKRLKRILERRAQVAAAPSPYLALASGPNTHNLSPITGSKGDSRGEREAGRHPVSRANGGLREEEERDRDKPPQARAGAGQPVRRNIFCQTYSDQSLLFLVVLRHVGSLHPTRENEVVSRGLLKTPCPSLALPDNRWWCKIYAVVPPRMEADQKIPPSFVQCCIAPRGGGPIPS